MLLVAWCHLHGFRLFRRERMADARAATDSPVRAGSDGSSDGGRRTPPLTPLERLASGDFGGESPAGRSLTALPPAAAAAPAVAAGATGEEGFFAASPPARLSARWWAQHGGGVGADLVPWAAERERSQQRAANRAHAASLLQAIARQQLAAAAAGARKRTDDRAHAAALLQRIGRQQAAAAEAAGRAGERRVDAAAALLQNFGRAVAAAGAASRRQAQHVATRAAAAADAAATEWAEAHPWPPPGASPASRVGHGPVTGPPSPSRELLPAAVATLPRSVSRRRASPESPPSAAPVAVEPGELSPGHRRYLERPLRLTPNLAADSAVAAVAEDPRRWLCPSCDEYACFNFCGGCGRPFGGARHAAWVPVAVAAAASPVRTAATASSPLGKAPPSVSSSSETPRRLSAAA